MRINRKNLICIMMDKDLTIGKLSEKSGISRGTISAIKTGKSCVYETIEKIAKALSVGVDQLIEVRE